MRLLLTSILVRSGVLSHLWDLANHLIDLGCAVTVAILKDRRIMAPRGIDEDDIPALTGLFRKEVALRFYRTAWQLMACARQQRAQLIHAHSPLVFPSSFQAAQVLSLPLVLTLHGVHPYLRQYPRTLALARRMIAIGPAQARAAGARHQHKVRIIANGIDLAKWQPGGFEAPPDDPLRLLWFGRSHGPASQGVWALDEAVCRLTAEGHRIEGRLVGQADVKSIRTLADCGWVADPLVHLQWSHVAFGHGRALREAMACGNVGFLLGHGYGGLVNQAWFRKHGAAAPISAIPQYRLPAPNPAAIADDLRRLHRDRAELRRLREEARRLAERHFDVRRMARLTLQIYRKCLPARLAGSRPRPRRGPAAGPAAVRGDRPPDTNGAAAHPPVTRQS